MTVEIQHAFHEVCKEAKLRENCFVSLYRIVPFYGGPEEGGWWGEHRMLQSYQAYPTFEQAMAAKEVVEELCKKMNENARKDYGDQCLKEMQWCDERNLDYDSLPEVNGEDSYFVVVEKTPGSNEHHDSGLYE